MKQTITLNDFRSAFLSIRPDNFSYAGLKVLYDYLTGLEEDCGIESELDVIAICCEWHEQDIESVLQEYGHDAVEDFSRETTVLTVDEETIIYQAY